MLNIDISEKTYKVTNSRRKNTHLYAGFTVYRQFHWFQSKLKSRFLIATYNLNDGYRGLTVLLKTKTIHGAFYVATYPIVCH